MTDRGEMKHKGGDNRFWKGGKGYLRGGFGGEMTSVLVSGVQAVCGNEGGYGSRQVRVREREGNWEQRPRISWGVLQ